MSHRAGAALAIIVLSLFTGSACAALPVTVRGFGTVGAVYNATNKAEFIRNLSQPSGVAGGWSAKPDTLAGLQITYKPNDSLAAVMQVVSRYNYDDSYQPRIAWAFIKYSPTPDIDLRAGRLGWDIYMQSDSRYVGYSYLWIRPPMEYFGTLLISHLDGVDAVFRHAFGDTVTWLKLYAGKAHEKSPSIPGQLYNHAGSDMYGGHFDVQTRHWHLRFGYNAYKFQHKLHLNGQTLPELYQAGGPAAEAFASQFTLAGKVIRYYTTGIEYDKGPLLSQWLYDYVSSDTRLYPNHQSAVWLVGYRVKQFTPYVIAAGTWLQNFDSRSGLPPTDPYYKAANALIVSTRSEQNTFSVGVRYDFAPKVDLKLQLDSVHTRHPQSYWRKTKPNWDGSTVLFSAAIDFVF